MLLYLHCLPTHYTTHPYINTQVSSAAEHKTDECRGQPHVLSETVKCPEMAKLAMAYRVGVSGVREFIRGVLGVNKLQARHVDAVISCMSTERAGRTASSDSASKAKTVKK